VSIGFVCIKKKVGWILKRQKGFTLIELLVVIAIIALLMSIMMPALSQVKKLAKDTMCMARLRQWGVIFHIYLDDNNDRLPDTVHFTRSEALMKLAKYRKRHKRAPDSAGNNYGDKYTYSEMAYCPSATKTIEEGGRPPFATWEYANSSYGLNLWLAHCEGGGRAERPKCCWTRSRIKRREEIPMFMDCFYEPPEDDCDPAIYHWDDPPEYGEYYSYGGNDMWRVCMDRHSGGINCLFRDFSARKVGLKELWEIKWNANWFTDPSGNPDYDPPDWPDWMKKYRDYR